VSASNFVPAYDHIVVVVEENHSYDEIIGNSQAPYINILARSGAVLSNYHAVAHPSEPNYFALYAGSTFGVMDDGAHQEPGPTLGSILAAHGRSFTGYVDSGSPAKHNPWESFSEGFSLEQNVSNFPTDFSRLPTVSFVVPNLADDMHDGSIGEGDDWLRSHIDAYAHWAVANNSLLVITFDEDDNSQANRVPTILVGAHISTGVNSTPSNHYDLLHTILEAYGLSAPNNAANASGLDGTIFLGDSDRNRALFGSVTDDPASLGGEVFSIYDGLLGRAPDPLGLEYWVSRVQSGATIPNITAGFLSSPEFTSDYGPYLQISAQAFVTDIYENVLHRAPDAGGLQYWTGLIAGGRPREFVADEIVISPEHQSLEQSVFDAGLFVPSATDATIARLYYAILDRAPDATGLQGWETSVAQGMSLATVAQTLLSSSEYTTRHGQQTNQQFVDTLYQDVFGATNSAAEQGWVNSLSQGTSRAAVAVNFAQDSNVAQHLVPNIEVGFALV
jgi:hypothetical protein